MKATSAWCRATPSSGPRGRFASSRLDHRAELKIVERDLLVEERLLLAQEGHKVVGEQRHLGHAAPLFVLDVVVGDRMEPGAIAAPGELAVAVPAQEQPG